MLGLFAITLPFFALVLAGYLAARRGLLPLDAVPGLNTFVLYFALPCLLFRFGSQMPVAQLLAPRLLAIYGVSAVLLLGLTIALTRSSRLTMKDAAFGALVATFPNSGFMGVPLITSLMGPQAAGPVINTLLIDLFVTSSLALALAQTWASAQSHVRMGTGAALGRALRAALSNPQPWAIGLGGMASALSLTLPAPALKVVSMLADAASPVALFTIGAVLWRSRVAYDAHAGQDTDRDATSAPPTQAALLQQALPTALLKLVVHPLLVGGLGWAAWRLGGWAVSPEQITVLVLVAALPSASNVSLLTERHGADAGRVARIIMVSTALAFVSFTAIAWGFGVGQAAR